MLKGLNPSWTRMNMVYILSTSTGWWVRTRACHFKRKSSAAAASSSAKVLAFVLWLSPALFVFKTLLFLRCFLEGTATSCSVNAFDYMCGFVTCLNPFILGSNLCHVIYGDPLGSKGGKWWRLHLDIIVPCHRGLWYKHILCLHWTCGTHWTATPTLEPTDGRLQHTNRILFCGIFLATLSYPPLSYCILFLCAFDLCLPTASPLPQRLSLITRVRILSRVSSDPIE